MKRNTILMSILLIAVLALSSLAQEMPLVYDVENSSPDYPKPTLLSIDKLPSITALPNPFLWADGRGSIVNKSDWQYRREEIKAQIEYYEIGGKPVRPDTITASYTGGVLTVVVTVEGRTLTLTSEVSLPSGSGPFPAVIGVGGFSGSGSIPANIFTDRNIATIKFNHNQVTTYGGPATSNPYYKLYPNLNPDNTGQYSAWAWGVSRIIDGLELVKDVLPIDLKHLAVTGCSWAGKMALFAGALDERIALTIAQESGGGGATSWRYSQSEPNGSVEKIDNTDYNWFENSMNQFAGDKVSRLPEDHHELMAMVAPRALYVTANPDYTWLSNPSSYVCSKGCQQVYDALGISDRFGFSIVGGHQHCQVPNSQITEIEAFVDKFLLGKDTTNTSNIADNPYTINLSPWIPWSTPSLENGASLVQWTNLVYPSNLQSGLDTSITFKWKNISGAEKYYFQLSTDQSFTAVVKNDSTADTTITFNGLLKNQRYYWHVKVRSASESGPWSSISNFITTLTLPAAPKIISASSNKTGYVTFNWSKVESADKYSYQVSTDKLFSNISKSGSTSDSSNSISWFLEGKKYYWRVRASNLAGSGSWSEVSNFIILYAPSNLSLKTDAVNEITLTWNDNSTIEKGDIIERKQNQGSYTVIDTLKESGTNYVDKNLEQGQSYTYRIKAYNDSLESEYSNEASMILTGINNEHAIPTEYSLSQNYPNPFNPATKIKFGLPKASFTKIIIYDFLGREVRTLINKEMQAGYHEINVDARNLPSGVYLYKIQSDEFTKTKKMILMK